MNVRRWQDNPNGLEPLAAQAMNYALHMMGTTGSVPPTVIADTDEGYIFCMPSSLADDAAKDRFAEVARLLAIAHSARSLVMVVGAWAKRPDASGHLDTKTPPSQSPDRQEVVALMLEDHSHKATSLLPILRDREGIFTSFGDPGLMPRDKPSTLKAAQAKAALLALGMNIINGGFDPTLN
jgi:hypothetical protein